MIDVIDLFAGPGGLGEGFTSLRDSSGKQIFRIIMSVEKDPYAHQTLRLRAFLRKILTQDGQAPAEYIDFLSSPSPDLLDAMIALHQDEWEQADDEALLEELVKGDDSLARKAEARLSKSSNDGVVLIGGPPCQAYSLVGRSRRTNDKEGLEKDVKQTLYECYLKFIEVIKPDAFVMENVQGILSARHAGYGVFGRILADMNSLGYEVHSLVNENPKLAGDYLVRADEYGIPQARKRVILLGTRVGSAKAPEILRKVAGNTTLGMALKGVPKLRGGFSPRAKKDQAELKEYLRSEASRIANELQDQDVRNDLLRIDWSSMPEDQSCGNIVPDTNIYNEWYRGRLGDSTALTCHWARTHQALDLTRYMFCASFARVRGHAPSLYDFPISLIPEHKNARLLAESSSPKRYVIFADRFRVQVENRPSTTITAHIRKDGHYYIHPDPQQCRSLTVREAARLQTFPDDYHFMGNRTQQYKQVGNAVPPMLAQQIAAVVGRYLGYDCTSYMESLHKKD